MIKKWVGRWVRWQDLSEQKDVQGGQGLILIWSNEEKRGESGHII